MAAHRERRQYLGPEETLQVEAKFSGESPLEFISSRALGGSWALVICPSEEFCLSEKDGPTGSVWELVGPLNATKRNTSEDVKDMCANCQYVVREE